MKYHFRPAGGDKGQVVSTEHLTDLVVLAAVKLTSPPGPASPLSNIRKKRLASKRNKRLYILETRDILASAQKRWRHAGAENRRCSWCELKPWQRDKTVCTLPFSQFFTPSLLLSLLWSPCPVSFSPSISHPVLHPSLLPFLLHPLPTFPSLLLSSSSSSHAAHGASRAAIVQDIPSLLMVSCAHTEGCWEKQASDTRRRHVLRAHTHTHKHNCRHQSANTHTVHARKNNRN